MGDVVILGSINMDIIAFVPRMPKTGETLMGDRLAYIPGGKGTNYAVAARRAGAGVRLLGRVGNDPFGSTLRGLLEQEGINTGQVGTSATAPSGIAIINVEQSGQNSVVVVSGCNAEVSPADAGALDFPSGAVAATQFETPLETVRAFFRKAKAEGTRTVLNTAPAIPHDAEVFSLADFIVLNETEFSFYSGLAEKDILRDALPAARRLLSREGQTMLLTLGAQGVMLIDGQRQVRIGGYSVKVVDTTGAGDCFTGNFAAALAAGLDAETAARRANAAAALSVQKIGSGAAAPFLADTEKFMRRSA